jgi:hypothetical protein
MHVPLGEARSDRIPLEDQGRRLPGLAHLVLYFPGGRLRLGQRQLGARTARNLNWATLICIRDRQIQ